MKNESPQRAPEVVIKEKVNQNWFDFGAFVTSYQKEEKAQPVIMDWSIL